MGKAWRIAIVASLLVSNAAALAMWHLERSRPPSVDTALRVLAEKLATAESRSERLVHEKRQLAEAAGSMTQRLKTRTVRAAVRNASSVVVEAVPYVGVATMVWVTAADIKDACETMQDINSMHSVFGFDHADTNEVCGLSVPSAKDVLRKMCRKTMICREDQQ